MVPVLNVDGFIQTQLYPVNVTAHREQPREGRMRRKNLRNPVTDGAIDSDIYTVADNFWGIDLNRNSAQGFGLQGGSSASETSLINRGGAPNSEPEILALQQAATLGPAARLRLYSDTHSFGEIYFAPTPDNARLNAITQTLSQRMIAASGRDYGYGPDPAGSPGIGTTADHFAFTYQVPAWTLEVEPANGGQDYGGLATHGHSGFILPAAEAPRMRADVTRQYLLGLYRQSGPPAAIAAEIRDTDADAVVYRARWDRSGASERALTVEVNEALVPGGNYRLWVAFNKPMRIRNSAGNVVSFAGQNRGAQIGTVELEVGAPAESVALDGGTWLGTPGGAPDGYLRYADDAFAVDFTLPDTLEVAESTPAALSLAVQDLARMALDGDPSSAVDWGSGHWLRYEDEAGTDGDAGGADCSFKPFVAPEAGAAAPATNVECGATTPPPPPPPPPPRGGGGGDGSSLLLALLGLLPFARRKRQKGDSHL